MNTKLEVGEKLIAKSECIMLSTKTKTLTIGNSYEIIKSSNHEIIIIDDWGDKHYFETETLDMYFTIKT